MKKNLFISLFVATNIGFFFLQIRKQMHFIKESFRKQKNERILAKLEQKEQDISNRLYMAQNKTDIKEYAHGTLHMIPVQLTQLKKLPHDHK